MGGGTSGLFFGTKGAKHVYQYSIFPDRIRKDSRDYSEATSNAGSQTGSAAQTREKRQLITANTILQKIHEYRAGSISAQELVDWLSFVVLSPQYRMSQKLRSVTKVAIISLSRSLSLAINSTSAFNQNLQIFEDHLHQL